MIEKIGKGAFKNLPLLEYLDLTYNKLTFRTLKPEIFEGNYSPETYEPLKSLKVLKLGSNQLHSLDPDLFEHLPNLEELHIPANPFTVIDHGSTVAISSIPNLRVIPFFNKNMVTVSPVKWHSYLF